MLPCALMLYYCRSQTIYVDVSNTSTSSSLHSNSSITRIKDYFSTEEWVTKAKKQTKVITRKFPGKVVLWYSAFAFEGFTSYIRRKQSTIECPQAKLTAIEAKQWQRRNHKMTFSPLVYCLIIGQQFLYPRALPSQLCVSLRIERTKTLNSWLGDLCLHILFMMTVY